jgi:hypothetical protein
MHKTGSTAIQRSLVAASGRDFIYPQLGGETFKPHHGDALVRLFCKRAPQLAEMYQCTGKKFDPGDHDEAMIEQAANEAGRRPVILSSEGAYVFFSKEDLLAFKSFADQLFDESRIVAYIRDPHTFISSALQSSIKSSHLSKVFAPSYKPYRLFEKFDQVFGQEKVQLFPYHRDSFPGRDVVWHFCANQGLWSRCSGETNVSLSRPAVSALFRLNRAVGSDPDEVMMRALRKAKKAIVYDFPHREWPKFRLSPEVTRPLIEANAEDLYWIEKRLGCSLRADQVPQDSDVRSEADLLEIDGHAKSQLWQIYQTLPNRAFRLLRRALKD